MKVLLGLSGGVDSTYCATLLKNLGYDVVGCVLRMHEYTDTEGAVRCASELSIPLITLDCSSEFDGIIKNYFVNEYMLGRTPNPCILCNERVKFEFLYRYAVEHGFDFIATGHYAHVDKTLVDGSVRYAISSSDSAKDQSYMLYRLPQHILSKLLLPVGDLDKSNVRREADLAGLSAAKSKDSQEICFLPDGKHYDFIEEKLGKPPKGNFIDLDG